MVTFRTWKQQVCPKPLQLPTKVNRSLNLNNSRSLCVLFRKIYFFRFDSCAINLAISEYSLFLLAL